MRHLWNWWSSILVGNVGNGTTKGGGVGVVFLMGVGAEVVEVMGCCWS